MDMIADILLVAGASGAALYCLVLARRLKKLTQLEGGMGSAIAVLSAQVDDLTRALARARNAAAESTAALEQQTNRAETALKRMELVMAAMHDLPAPGSHAQPAQRADPPMQPPARAVSEIAAMMNHDAATDPPRRHPSPEPAPGPAPAPRVLPWKSVRQDSGTTRPAEASDTGATVRRSETPPDNRDSAEQGGSPGAPHTMATTTAGIWDRQQAGASAPPGGTDPRFGTPTEVDGRDGAPVRAGRRTRVVRRRPMREAAE